MSNSTDEYWSIVDVDGTDVSLHQWGWAVTSVGGSRYDLPPRRGSDMTMAYRPGQIHRRKLPDARQMSLVMFMVGMDPATGNAPGDQRLEFNNNWDTLRRLVFRHSMLSDQRVKLTRRWFLTADTFPATRSGDVCIQGDPGVPAPGPRLLSAFGWAEMSGTMDPTMTGRFRADFQLDFTMADPYFYGDRVNTTLTPGQPVYVFNDGHDVAASGYVNLDLYGTLVNPKVTNLSTNPDSWVKYNGTVGGSGHIAMDIARFSAIDDVTNFSAIGRITSYGARFWVSLLPGVNKIELTADSGTGNAVLSFRPQYL